MQALKEGGQLTAHSSLLTKECRLYTLSYLEALKFFQDLYSFDSHPQRKTLLFSFIILWMQRVTSNMYPLFFSPHNLIFTPRKE